MTAFLNWLYAAANAVYSWFGGQFYNYLHVVLNTWNWIVQQASQAYSDAVDWTWDKIRDVQQDISGLFDWVTYQIDGIKSDLLADLSGLYDWVAYQVETVPGAIVEAFQGVIDGIYDYINGIPETISNWFYDRVIDIQNWFYDNFGWVTGIIDWLTGMVNLIPFELFDQVYDFFANGYVTIKQFLDNPIVFILDLLQEKIVSALCFILAHALGTTQSELPYTPPWKE